MPKTPMPKNLGDAWDQAEKLVAERGSPWAINRRGDKFWIETDGFRLTCVDEAGRPTFVLNLYRGGQMLSWSMTWADALAELVSMIAATTHIDGDDRG